MRETAEARDAEEARLARAPDSDYLTHAHAAASISKLAPEPGGGQARRVAHQMMQSEGRDRSAGSLRGGGRRRFAGEARSARRCDGWSAGSRQAPG